MAKLVRSLSVALASVLFLIPLGVAPAAAQEICTQTVIYYPPHSPGYNTGPVDCSICPPGVQNWVLLYNGIVIVYTCHFR